MKETEKNVGTVLYVTADAALAAEIEKELKVADPLEGAEASLKNVEMVDENTEGDDSGTSS